jgi:hypothetical protein
MASALQASPVTLQRLLKEFEVKSSLTLTPRELANVMRNVMPQQPRKELR